MAYNPLVPVVLPAKIKRLPNRQIMHISGKIFLATDLHRQTLTKAYSFFVCEKSVKVCGKKKIKGGENETQIET